MKIQQLLESTQTYYHGSPKRYTNGYDFNVPALNRGSNIKGLYLTTNIKVAQQYAGQSGVVYEVVVSPTNTFVDGKTSVTDIRFKSAYKSALLKYTNYKIDWIETALIPDLIDDGRMKKDLSGDAKKETLLNAGYDSMSFADMDGPVLVILDLSAVTSFKPME
jgi:hypothetical protein